MRYEDFTLQVDTTSAGGLRTRVLRSPAGEGASEGAMPDDLDALRAVLAGGGVARGTRQMLPGGDEPLSPLSPQATGEQLFDCLIRDRVKSLFDQSLGGSFGAEERGLRIQIKVDPRDPRLEKLNALPWELLYRAETEDYLALSRRTPVVRYLDVPRPIRPIPLPETLRVLVAMSSPSDQAPLNLAEERKKLEDATAGQPGLKLTFVENAAAEVVRERLVAERSHVLHFMGHGDFDVEQREGLLYFERDDGSAEPVSGRALATSLKDLPDLGLVFLNACNTARSSGSDGGSPFSGVASALVLGGMPAVLAMQRPIADRAAIRFSQAFYRHLAAGEPLDIALTEGRQAIHVANARTLEWAIPVLFVRVPDGMIFGKRPELKVVEAAPPPSPTVPAFLTSEALEPPKAKNWLPIALGTVALLGVGIWAGLTALKPKEPVLDKKVEETKLTGPENVGGSDVSQKQTAATTQPTRTSSKQPVPSTSEPPPVSEPISSDPSDLSCDWLSLARRDPSGLKAQLSCRNTGSKKVVVTVQASMSDDNSSAYSVVGSSLSSKGGGFVLEVPAGGSKTFSFNFPAPKLGGSQFYLELLPTAGGTMELANSSIGI